MEESRGNARILNEVYRHIFAHGASSRQMLAADLGISLPTVTQTINQLKDAGMVFNAGEFESTGGRKAIMFSIVPDARVAIGIDITRSHLSLVLTDLHLNILDYIRMRVLYEDTREYYELMAQKIEEILDKNRINREILLGVGVSIPAHVDEVENEVNYVRIIKLPEHFYERLKEYIPYPVKIHNDANSAGWAERWVRKDDRPVIYLSLSNSVGGAIIMNRVFTGCNWRGGEFGHMTIVPHGKKCYCGKYGCLDAYCSAWVLSDFTDGDIKVFFEAMETSDNKGYKNVFREYMENLAIAVNNLRMCFDCDVVLGGAVGACMEDYLEEFREITARLSPFEDNADYIQICSFKTEAAAAGAALFYIDSFARKIGY